MSEAKVCTDTGDFCCLAELEAEFTPDTVFSLGSMCSTTSLFYSFQTPLAYLVQECSGGTTTRTAAWRDTGAWRCALSSSATPGSPTRADRCPHGTRDCIVTRDCIATRDTLQDQSWDYSFLSASDTVFTKLALSATFSPGAGVYREVCPDIYTYLL